jgi:putative MATE family efflux protein
LPLLRPSLWSRIGALAAPAVLAMLSQTAINIVDTILIGHLPRAVSIPGQSALGISLPILWFVGGFLSAISVGTQAVTARRAGEGDAAAAGKSLGNSLVVSLSSGLVGSAIGFFAIPFVFPLFHSNPEVVRLGVTYTQIRFLGVANMAMTASYKSFFDGIGKTHVHMVAAFAMNALNLALAALLVFGLFGFPRLEVQGAAWAAIAANTVGLAVMVAFSLRARYRTPYRLYSRDGLSAPIRREIVGLSVPSGIATLVIMTGFLFFFRIVAELDARTTTPEPVNTAATKIIVDILSVTFVGCIAFGTATATLVSQSLGAKDPTLAEAYGWESAKIGILVFGAIGALTFAFPDVVVGFFNTDPDVIHVARTPLRLVACYEWIVAAAMILTQALFGAGNTRFVMFAELTLHFFILLPAAWIFGITLHLGLFGIWMAAGLYGVGLASAMALKFRGGAWKDIKL